MLVMAVHRVPSLTQERYEEVIRRLTNGKSRLDSLSDLPFDGVLMHVTGQTRQVRPGRGREHGHSGSDPHAAFPVTPPGSETPSRSRSWVSGVRGRAPQPRGPASTALREEPRVNASIWTSEPSIRGASSAELLET
jgi:hypothetical protein